MVENPPASPDKEAGWRLLRDMEIAPLVESALLARARHAEVTARGIAARTKYGPEDRAAWRCIAAEPSVARLTKLRQAQIIAKRLGLPDAAIETIRKQI